MGTEPENHLRFVEENRLPVWSISPVPCGLCFFGHVEETKRVQPNTRWVDTIEPTNVRPTCLPRHHDGTVLQTPKLVGAGRCLPRSKHAPVDRPTRVWVGPYPWGQRSGCSHQVLEGAGKGCELVSTVLQSVTKGSTRDCEVTFGLSKDLRFGTLNHPSLETQLYRRRSQTFA